MAIKRNKSFLYAFIALLLLVVTVIGGRGISPAFAATSNYTTALEDLYKDSSFDAAKYPYKAGDYSVSVIQIAESTGGELFIYTYQPCQLSQYLVATQINMSLTDKTQFKPKLYDLTLINTGGVFGKYKVNDLTVSKDATRHYNITSIYRAWVKQIDGDPVDGNTVSEKAFSVGQLWTVSGANEEITYDMQPIEIIEIDKQFVGCRRYINGINPFVLGGNACDAHFLTFSTKRNIDMLISAVVVFSTREYVRTAGGIDYGQRDDKSVTLYYDEFAENAAGGWLGKKARWDRIASTSDFLNCGLEFTDEEKSIFSQYDWVLNFYETTFDWDFESVGTTALKALFYWDTSDMYTMAGTNVYDVAVLRLEFESEGEIYNLGVVSDKQSGGVTSVTGGDLFKWASEMPWWGWLIIAIVVIIVLSIILQVCGVLFPVLKIVFKGVKYFFIGLWYVVSSPVRLIIWIVHTVQGDGTHKTTRKKKTTKARNRQSKSRRNTPDKSRGD